MMKKIFLGIIIGFCLSFSITAYAQEIQSMIGKLVSGQFPVIVDGETLVNPAIVVEGTSYLPVRAFGEKMGYKVTFDTEGKVLLDAIKTTAATATNNGWGTDDWGIKEKAKFDRDMKMNEVKMLEEKINEALTKIDNNKNKLIKDKENYLEMGGDPALYETSTAYKLLNQYIADSEKFIAQATIDLEQLEAQKAALEAQP